MNLDLKQLCFVHLSLATNASSVVQQGEVKMPSSLKLPPILPGQSLVGQDTATTPQNGRLQSMYTTTTKLHYQQPTQYPGSVLRAVEAYFKSKKYFS